MNIANFANSVEERNGSEEGNVDLIQRYKYTDKGSIGLYGFRDDTASRKEKCPWYICCEVGLYVLKEKIKLLVLSQLDLCFRGETVYHFPPIFAY